MMILSFRSDISILEIDTRDRHAAQTTPERGAEIHSGSVSSTVVSVSGMLNEYHC